MSATELLLNMVSIPSVSSLSNLPMIDYITRRLDPKQWHLQLHPYTDSEGVEKASLVAFTRNGDGHNSELTLVCHTDTVPYQTDWHEAVRPVVQDGRVYGRGSCDVKGFLACTLAAIQQVDLRALSKPLALVFTADEEVGCIGAKQLAREEAFHSRWLVIGEPTGLSAVRAGKGYSVATLTVRGTEAHSAFPANGRSAIFDAGRVLSGLERVARKLEDYPNDQFDPPFTTLNVGLIQGGKAKNIVPGACQLTLEWRPIPGQDSGLVPQLVRQELDTIKKGFPEFYCEFDILRTDPAFAPSKLTGLSERLAALAETGTSAIAFGSEAAHLSGLALETVVFGPGDMTVAHKSGEYIEVEALAKCTSILRTCVEEACGA